MGGEKAAAVTSMLYLLGSPPRGRGKEKILSGEKTVERITPAWAGKRGRPGRGCSKDRDHPRVGGEKKKMREEEEYRQGSPPRGRGKAQITEHFAGVVGITPAWAGKRRYHLRGHEEARDHPRVGGEKVLQICPIARRLGSPPRGRGKDKPLFALSIARRITPAWAGKSLMVRLCNFDFGDHPRVGGEKTKKIP